MIEIANLPGSQVDDINAFFRPYPKMLTVVFHQSTYEKAIECILSGLRVVTDKIVAIETVQAVPGGKPHIAAAILVDIIDGILSQSLIGSYISKIV